MAHKYGAKPTVIDGIRFASLAESRRYQELKLLEKAGKIHDLRLQPEWPLIAKGGGPVGKYRADFEYCTCEGGAPNCTFSSPVFEDVKGMKTPMYRWKKKHVEAQYGITITEVSSR